MRLRTEKFCAAWPVRLRSRSSPKPTSSIPCNLFSTPQCWRIARFSRSASASRLSRLDDCIGLLIGSRAAYQAYLDAHSGVYYRSPGEVEFQTPGQTLEPAFSSVRKKPGNNKIGERRILEELVARYGEENGKYLYEQFGAFRSHYKGADLYLHAS